MQTQHQFDSGPTANYVPRLIKLSDQVAASMVADDYYNTHTRVESAAEFHRRFTAAMNDRHGYHAAD